MEVKRVKWSSLFLPVYSEEGANSGEMVNPAAGQMCPEAERKRWGEGGGPPMPSWAAFSSDLIFFFFCLSHQSKTVFSWQLHNVHTATDFLSMYVDLQVSLDVGTSPAQVGSQPGRPPSPAWWESSGTRPTPASVYLPSSSLCGTSLHAAGVCGAALIEFGRDVECPGSCPAIYIDLLHKFGTRSRRRGSHLMPRRKESS